MVFWLVVSTPLNNISQLGRIIPYIMEHKTCLKPPTSMVFFLEQLWIQTIPDNSRFLVLE